MVVVSTSTTALDMIDDLLCAPNRWGIVACVLWGSRGWCLTLAQQLVGRCSYGETHFELAKAAQRGKACPGYVNNHMC